VCVFIYTFSFESRPLKNGLMQTRKKLKEAYATEFAATIERAEKQIILARHGRRLLALLDDDPVIPGDARAQYQGASQARQILNDAEDDLREWRPTPDETLTQPAKQTAGGNGVTASVGAGGIAGAGSVAGEQQHERQQQQGSPLQQQQSQFTSPMPGRQQQPSAQQQAQPHNQQEQQRTSSALSEAAQLE
jgi:hypothetical protein